MKRVLQVLLFVICCTAIGFGQQNNLGYVRVNGPANPPNRQEGELECSPGSIFSQPPVTPNSGYFCDANDFYQYTEVIEDYPALTENIGKVTVWAGYYNRDYSFCTPATAGSDSYQVNFYGINAGNPAYPGALIQTFTLSPTLFQLAGNFYYDMYRVEFTLPSPVSSGAGWVGIGRLTRTDDCIMFWWDNQETGYQNTGKQRHNGQLEETGYHFVFCLEGSKNVPLANWPLVLAGALIAIVVGIRYLKFRS